MQTHLEDLDISINIFQTSYVYTQMLTMKTALSSIVPVTNLVMLVDLCVNIYANGGPKRLCMVNFKTCYQTSRVCHSQVTYHNANHLRCVQKKYFKGLVADGKKFFKASNLITPVLQNEYPIQHTKG